MSEEVIEKLVGAKYSVNVSQNELVNANQKIEEALAILNTKGLLSPTASVTLAYLADNDGAVEIAQVSEHIQRLPKFVQDKVYKRFIFEKAYRTAVFPNEDARTKAYLNMSNRRWVVPFLGGSQEVEQGILFEVKQTNYPADFSLPPERQRSKYFERVGISTEIFSTNWDPSWDEAKLYARWKELARAECVALGYKPEDYGL